MFRNYEFALMLAGLAQLGIAATSLLIPRLLGWREETAALKPLTRQVFWTYAAYIFSINAAFGLLSLLAPHALLDGSTLARAVCAFIALYWTGRVTLQFVAYDRSVTRGKPLFRFAEIVYVSAFVYLALVYAGAAIHGAPASPPADGAGVHACGRRDAACSAAETAAFRVAEAVTR